MNKKSSPFLFLCGLSLGLVLLAGCDFLSGKEPVETPLAEAVNPVLTLSGFSALRGWDGDAQADAVAAFARSCARIARRKPDGAFGPLGGTYGDFQTVCARITPEVYTDHLAARQFFENNFNVWHVTADNGRQDGLFTGYYEASLNGSRMRHGPYQTMLRKRPADLVMVDLGMFRESLKGQRIAGRVVDGRLRPFEDHRAIDQGALPDDDDLALVYVDDPVKAFFLHIQGSGRIMLDDGEEMRVGYAGQNGHPYYAVGRELVKRGHMATEDVTMQSIEAWLNANPDQIKDILYTNPSYVFFTALDGDGPLGGENVALTAGRSLALDRSLYPYGMPVWLDLQDQDFKQLMIAQDTGGAIRGPVRGDIFFGYGAQAELLAGKMKSQGQWWFLLPKTVLQP